MFFPQTQKQNNYPPRSIACRLNFDELKKPVDYFVGPEKALRSQ
jgi:hypothetical protein